MSRKRKSVMPDGCVDEEALLAAIARHCAYVPSHSESTYDISYPEFIEYFNRCDSISRHHLIIAANFAYGWMPTILNFAERKLDESVGYLQRARKGDDLTIDEIRTLSKLINNSVVGASKLLHFVQPGRYTIWDSRVAAYLNSRVETPSAGAEQYSLYNDCCRHIAQKPTAQQVTRMVRDSVGYAISPIRALELVMYHNGLQGRTYKSE